MKPCIAAYCAPRCSITTDLSTKIETTITDLLPAGMCPLAFHTLLPYIYTIVNNGWFGWVQRTRAVDYRKPVLAGDFTSNAINRLYPNEVLVQCPNPNISVVFGVGPDVSKNRIRIRVLRRKTDCPFNHAPGDDLIIDPALIKLPLADVAVVLGTAIYHALSGAGTRLGCTGPGSTFSAQLSPTADAPPGNHDMCESIVASDQTPAGSDAMRLNVIGIKQRCRYHRTLGTYDISRLSPPGMCPALFHAAYMDSLRLLYTPTVLPDTLTIRCPAVSRAVRLSVGKIKKKSWVPDIGKRWLNRLLNLINRPIDFLDYRIIYTVDSVTGGCPCSHIRGQQYEFNLNHTDTLCPASFHALYPYLLTFMNAGSVIWEPGRAGCQPETIDRATVVCPDCVGASYRFSRP